MSRDPDGSTLSDPPDLRTLSLNRLSENVETVQPKRRRHPQPPPAETSPHAVLRDDAHRRLHDSLRPKP